MVSRMRIGGTVVVSLLTLNPLVRADRIYQEQRGIVVMEFESAPAVDDWVLETEHKGYSGEGYYTWRGEDHFGQAGPGKLTFKFLIQHPGLYHLRLRSLHMHDDTSLENDVWTRMDAGDWKKTFCTPNKEWAWMTKHDFGGYKPWASYVLGKGVHVLEFAGRSRNFSIDLIHLYKDGVFWIEDHSLPKSPTLQSGDYAPRADAGPEKNLTLPQDHVMLSGAGEDVDGTVVAYQWEKVSGPSARMQGQHSQTLKVTELEPGVYVFRLKVTDKAGGTGYDEAKVTVYPASHTSVAEALFELSGGQVTFEVEEAPVKNHWSLETENPGYSGQGYVVWRGSNYFDDPQAGCQLAYRFKAEQNGRYCFRVHNRHDHDLGDQENDNWVRFDDGPWYKFYSMEKQVWTWTTRFVDFEGTWRLDAGVHTMYIAPRSFGYKMDQIQIAREGLLSETDP
ncbi:MAG: PKD domain-containing protein [Planctomycetota bacterium]